MSDGGRGGISSVAQQRLARDQSDGVPGQISKEPIVALLYRAKLAPVGCGVSMDS